MVAALYDNHRMRRAWHPLTKFPPMTIALDADDVLLDMVPVWLEVYNAVSGDSLFPADVNTWEIEELVLPAWRGGPFRALRTPDLYDVIQPVPGAQEGVLELLVQGHRLVVVTHDDCAHREPKVACIRRWFPDLTNIIFAKNKRAAVRYDILVDDGAHNYPQVLFQRAWNTSTELHPGQLGALHWPGVVAAVHMHAISRHYGIFD